MSDSLQPHGLYTPLGPSVLGISQARTLEGVAISSSRGSSRPRDQTYISYIAGRFFPEPLGKPQDQEEDDPVQTITQRKGISQELIPDLNFDVQIDYFYILNIRAPAWSLSSVMELPENLGVRFPIVQSNLPQIDFF